MILSGGGTAGHVYPALSVADALSGLAPSDRGEILYIGSRSGMERALVERAGLAYHGLPVGGGVRGAGLPAAGNALRLVASVLPALGEVRSFRPQAILATGGYVCVPVVVACWLCRVPALVYLPDLEPGWAIRFLTPLARQVAVSEPESLRFFPAGKALVTGYPVRRELGTIPRGEARAQLGLDPTEATVLIFGGSRGAQHINDVVAQGLDALLSLAQIVHVCGSASLAGLAKAQAALAESLRRRYHVYDYLHDMPAALAAADLAVSRAGASVLGEYPAVGLPSILVPYAGGHADQVRNAGYLAQRGAARVIADDQLTAESLVSAVRSLLAEPATLAAMAQAASALARPRAAEHLAQTLLGLAQAKGM